jgi:hypothetical protein
MRVVEIALRLVTKTLVLQLAAAGASDGERTKNPTAARWREMWRISHHPRRYRWYSWCVVIPSEVDARDWTVRQRLIPVLTARGRSRA